LQDYLQAHPADANAAKLMERLKAPASANPPKSTAVAADEAPEMTTDAGALLVASNWLPPDVDEKMAPVEAARLAL